MYKEGNLFSRTLNAIAKWWYEEEPHKQPISKANAILQKALMKAFPNIIELKKGNYKHLTA